MEIDKFKMKDGEYFVSYKMDNGDKYTLETVDEPNPELIEALDDLRDEVIEICEEPEDSDIDITGITFSHGVSDTGDEVLGTVIIAKKHLKNSTGVLNIITPHRINRYYQEQGDEGQLMSADLYGKVLVVIEEIDKYIQGDRAQGDLFKENEAA